MKHRRGCFESLTASETPSRRWQIDRFPIRSPVTAKHRPQHAIPSAHHLSQFHNRRVARVHRSVVRGNRAADARNHAVLSLDRNAIPGRAKRTTPGQNARPTTRRGVRRFTPLQSPDLVVLPPKVREAFGHHHDPIFECVIRHASCTHVLRIVARRVQGNAERAAPTDRPVYFTAITRCAATTGRDKRSACSLAAPPRTRRLRLHHGSDIVRVRARPRPFRRTI